MTLTLWLLFNGYRLTAITDSLMGKVKARLPVAAKARAQQHRRFLLHH